ncbi:MAG: M1 family metallopeptidase, partial [Chitinophagaceae bacterium]|nr:M1 family metallopeptidase [Chitinophagaceae bacterium]
MKYLLTIFIGFLGLQMALGQGTYWQQQVNFTIQVTLNDTAKTLDGFEKITYTNNSPDTLRFIWFHIWPNAYRNDKTAYTEQALANGSTQFYFSNDEEKGYINQLDFRVNNIAASIEAHPQHIDIVKLILPTPIAPKQTITITTPFFVKLPYNFSRGGYTKDGFQVTQWYPKPAVYDANGWHEMPYLDQGEFYSEFGNYEVQITLPDNYIVAATGKLDNEEALNKLKQLGKQTATLQPNYIAFVEAQKKKAIVTKAYAPKKKIEPVKPVVLQKPRLITYTYKQDNCHDFAWFASKHFIVQYDTVALKEKTVDVFSFYQPSQINNWNKSIAYAKDGLKKYSNWIGDYPYNTASIVSGEENEFSGGMEYPTITLITTNAAGKYLDATIVHEIGHNWFHGALGNNERKYAWMDESINTYYQNRYEAEKYVSEISTMPKWLQNKLPVDIESLIYTTVAGLKKSQPIDTSSTAFT